MRRSLSFVLILLVAAAAAAAVVSSLRHPAVGFASEVERAASGHPVGIPDRTDVPSEVIPYSGPAAGLEARMDWALGEAGKSRFKDGCWIAYSFKRLMNESSHIGTFNSDRTKRDLTIEEILSGKKRDARVETDGEVVRRTAREILDELELTEREPKKVLKDLGIFFLYGPGSSPSPQKARMSHLDLAFDFEGLPLLWLGETSEEESLSVIRNLYAKAETDKFKKGLVVAAGVHSRSNVVVPFFEKILTGEDSEAVRKDAAFWLGQQDDKAAMKILVRSAKSDESKAVRKNAVFSLSQMKVPEAVDEVIALARNDGGAGVRKEAVFWLGQIASRKAGAALEEFATKDADVKIQKQAVFALSQLPDNQGVEPLIKIVKTHPDPRIRKQAVFWLGECNDPRALETLIEIVKK